MLKCTYIVLLNNNENNIFQLVKSLKELNSSFRKEFIIINDGSKDNSLKLIKSATSDLPRTTIITQKNQGSTITQVLIKIIAIFSINEDKNILINRK